MINIKKDIGKDVVEFPNIIDIAEDHEWDKSFGDIIDRVTRSMTEKNNVADHRRLG